MPQYLLLRDNKQSGPYSFEELTAKGLKAYDLIWVEGKSAAWRYPSELNELKPFAPVVEEQPYDRFYKREEMPKNKQPENPAITSADNSIPKVNTGNAQKMTNRKVVVILPGGQYRESQQESVPFHETVENNVHPQVKRSTGIQKPVGLEEITYERRQSPAPTEERTVRKQPDKKSFDRKTGVWNTKASKILTGTFMLLTIAGFIGWAFSRTEDVNKIPDLVTPSQTVKIEEPKAVYNNESALAVNNDLVTREEVPASDMVVTDSAVETLMDIPMASKPPVKNRPASKPTILSPEQQASLDTEVMKDETVAKPVDRDDVEKRSVKRNINELVRVAKNEYKVGPFGGISNIQLKVTNGSPYSVDLVVVEVKYMLANKKEFKTENLYFKNLAPGASLIKEAPKSARGIKIESKVALITSKALGMYQASL